MLLKELDAAGIDVANVAGCQKSSDAINDPSGARATLVFVDENVRWGARGVAGVGGGCWSSGLGGSYLLLRAEKLAGRWIVHAEAGTMS